MVDVYLYYGNTNILCILRHMEAKFVVLMETDTSFGIDEFLFLGTRQILIFFTHTL